MNACTILSGFLPSSNRLTNSKGLSVLKKSKKTMIDITRRLLDPRINLPIFYAVNLNRTPPVGIDHAKTLDNIDWQPDNFMWLIAHKAKVT